MPVIVITALDAQAPGVGLRRRRFEYLPSPFDQAAPRAGQTARAGRTQTPESPLASAGDAAALPAPSAVRGPGHRAPGRVARAPTQPVALNTSAIPPSSSELFGHEKGSFTGAAASNSPMAARCSWTRSATCRPRCRTRLLRVAKGGVLPPVKVDVRVIATTHQNLDVNAALPRRPLSPPQRHRRRAARRCVRAPRCPRTCCCSLSAGAADSGNSKRWHR